MGWRGKWHSRESIEARGSEQAKGIPSPPPRIADSLVRLEDHERQAPARQVISDRQTRLTAAYDNGLNMV
jgi:hypothetical protein